MISTTLEHCDRSTNRCRRTLRSVIQIGSTSRVKRQKYMLYLDVVTHEIDSKQAKLNIVANAPYPNLVA
jgi:hypothetical protein